MSVCLSACLSVWSNVLVCGRVVKWRIVWLGCQAAGQVSNLESYLDHIAYEVDNVEPALSADRDSLAQQINEIQVRLITYLLMKIFIHHKW